MPAILDRSWQDGIFRAAGVDQNRGGGGGEQGEELAGFVGDSDPVCVIHALKGQSGGGEARSLGLKADMF